MLTELFDEQTIPVLRRLGQRDRGTDTHADHETRRQVWAALLDCGAFDTPVAAAELMGAALYQSPFLDTVAAAEMFDLPRGTATALALREIGADNPASPPPITVDGDRITATRRFVAFAPDVVAIVVVGHGDAALVPVRQPGVVIRRQDDTGRGDLYAVDFRAAAGQVVDVRAVFPDVVARARVRHAAYLIGAALAAIELAADYLRERRAFGQPLARSTALAYRLAALYARAHAVKALIDTEPNQKVGAQVALLAGEVARRSAQEAVHLHGAYGMTERCDAQVFYRRAAIDAQWWGKPADLRRELAKALAEPPPELGSTARGGR
jgi:alkylation response protein AidB-like acyl-CoA dehydrogenase